MCPLAWPEVGSLRDFCSSCTPKRWRQPWRWTYPPAGRAQWNYFARDRRADQSWRSLPLSRSRSELVRYQATRAQENPQRRNMPGVAPHRGRRHAAGGLSGIAPLIINKNYFEAVGMQQTISWGNNRSCFLIMYSGPIFGHDGRDFD